MAKIGPKEIASKNEIANYDIINLIVKTPEPEDAGSRTQNRFEYQKHWAICHLLELHEKGVDFILAVECHDDVLEILPGSSKQLNFYQIKTKNKDHINVSPANKTTMTYLGRMLCHLHDFGTESVERLTLISNRAFKGKINNHMEEFNFRRLDDFEDRIPRAIWDAAIETVTDSTIKTKLKSLCFSPEVLTFEVSDLSLENFSDMTKGKILTFLEKHKKDQAAMPFYKALLAEIGKQSSREKKVLEINDFIQNRSIDKKRFDKIVREVIEQPLMKERIANIINELTTCGILWSMKKNYERELQNIEIDLYAKNSYYHWLSDKISDAYSEVNLEALNFNEIIDQIYLSIKDDELVQEVCRQKSELYIKACIALRINE